MENEKWLPVVGFEDFYSVSDLGNIRRDAPSRNNSPIGKVLKACKHRDGYSEVCLATDKHYTPMVHVLVARAFIGLANGRQVNHKDGNKKNNFLENLEYVTAKENINHAFRIKGNWTKKGVECGSSKLKEGQVLEIRKLAAVGLSTRKIAGFFNVTHGNIGAIVNRKTWVHV